MLYQLSYIRKVTQPTKGGCGDGNPASGSLIGRA